MRFKSNDDIFGDHATARITDAFDFNDPANYTMEEMRQMVRTSREIPEDLKEMIAVEIARRAPLDREYRKTQPYFQKGVFGGKRWAIRKDDFRLLETIAGTAI